MAEPKNSWSLNGLPMWARVGAMVGFPSLAAGFLIYFITQVLAADVQQTRRDLVGHDRRAEGAIEQNATAIKRSQESLREVVYLLRLICQQRAPNPTDCLRAGPVGP